MCVSVACPFGGLPRAASSGVAVWAGTGVRSRGQESGEADMSSVEKM